MDRRILYSFGTTWIMTDFSYLVGISLSLFLLDRNELQMATFAFVSWSKTESSRVSVYQHELVWTTGQPLTHLCLFSMVLEETSETKLRLKWNILGFPFQVSWAMKELVWALKMTPSIPRLLHYDITFHSDIDYDVNTQDSDGFDLHCCDLILVRILIRIPHTKTHDKQLLALLPCCSRRQMHLWERLP